MAGKGVNRFMVSLRVVSALIIVGLVGAVVGGVVAYEVWAGEITWQYNQVNYDFTVVGEQNIDYGVVVGSAVKSAVYEVRNVGNAPIVVVANCVPSSNSTVSASWDKTSVEVAVGGNATFTLTLVITGPGNCAVSFSKQT